MLPFKKQLTGNTFPQKRMKGILYSRIYRKKTKYYPLIPSEMTYFTAL